MLVKAAYHRLVPARLRYPIGALRRRLDDAWLRLGSRPPLPPRHLLEAVQMTPRQREYLEVGRRSAAGLRRQLERRGIDGGRALDFGCGLGRTLRHLGGAGGGAQDDDKWTLAGCDVDRRLVDWCRGALPGVDWRVNEPAPPLPFAAESFDVLWSVSVFTHFDESEQRLWAKEIARVLRPGGVALISLMGPRAMGAFPALETAGRRGLEKRGFFFEPGGEAFNRRGAFHDERGVRRLFAPHFELEAWLDGGLDGFQDLAVLDRC